MHLGLADWRTMLRPVLGCLFVLVSGLPFAIFVGCSDEAPKTGGTVAPDAATANPDGAGPIVVLPEEDAGPVRCIPASSLAPANPTAPLAGSVGGAAFPSAPQAYARPITSLPGFYEVDISEGEASCANADGGTRGVRLVVAADGTRCSSTDPTRAEFYRKTAAPYVRPAGTEGILTAKPAGSRLEVGVIVGAFKDGDLPADGLSGTTTIDICK